MEVAEKAPVQDKTLVPTENLKKLHDNLSKREGFNVPLEQFEKDMQDESNLKRLHDNLAKQQVDVLSIHFSQLDEETVKQN